MLKAFRLLISPQYSSPIDLRVTLPLVPALAGIAGQGIQQQSRTFATAQPAPEKLAAVPFSVTRQEAEKAFESFHTAFQLLVRPHKDKIKETFLPFWIASCSVQTTLTRADIGFTESGQQYNRHTKTWDSVQKTIWRTVHLHQEWDRTYPASNAGLQVYASYKYPRAQMQSICPGQAADLARRMTPDLLQSNGSTRRVGPFHMGPATAQAMILQRLEAAERKAATDFVRTAYSCDQVRALELSVRRQGFRMSPLYVPAFVISGRQMLGSKLRTFVSGVNPQQVTGDRMYNEGLIGAMTGLAGLAIITWTNAWEVYSASNLWLLGVVVPAGASIVLVQRLPWIQQAWHKYLQAGEQDRMEREAAEGGWDAEWIKAYWQAENRQRERSESQENFRQKGGRSRFAWSNQSQGQASDPHDRKGYYKTLEVKPDASQQEVSAAYRGLVMRWHPDHHPEEAGKARATMKLQEVNEAYSVLRSATKRRMYDAGG